MTDNTRYWRYRAKPSRVVDGDTLDLIADLGFGIHNHIRVRLSGIDTAEIYGVDATSEEFQEGKKHKEAVEEWVLVALDTDREWPLTVETEKDEKGKYGRYLAHVYMERGHPGEEYVAGISVHTSLNHWLVKRFPEVENPR